jgi:DNA-binding GntR family transcriptional regulator
VYQGLRDKILSLDLPPGSSIEEKVIVAAYGVSRTPVREAFVRLAAEGLIELLPNRGARVASLDLVHVQEHLEALELIQRAVSVLAAQRRVDRHLDTLAGLAEEFETARDAREPSEMIRTNWQFHQAIGEACGNRAIADMYESTLTDGLRVARLAMSYECYGSEADYEIHLNRIVDEHRRLVGAIRDQDLTAAGRLADSHTGAARQRVSDFLSRRLEPEVVSTRPESLHRNDP